jgi:hypothetical protein
MLYLEYRSTKLFCAKNSLLNIHGLHSFIFSYSSTRDDLMVEDSHPIDSPSFIIMLDLTSDHLVS